MSLEKERNMFLGLVNDRTKDLSMLYHALMKNKDILYISEEIEEYYINKRIEMFLKDDEQIPFNKDVKIFAMKKLSIQDIKNTIKSYSNHNLLLDFNCLLGGKLDEEVLNQNIDEILKVNGEREFLSLTFPTPVSELFFDKYASLVNIVNETPKEAILELKNKNILKKDFINNLCYAKVVGDNLEYVNYNIDSDQENVFFSGEIKWKKSK